ncbi:DUF5686 family protein [Corallibacter vietnamensis]
MLKHVAVVFFFLMCFCAQAQITPKTETDSVKTVQDSLKRANFIKHLGLGYFPTRFLDLDLRYLIKYNQYEALRTGLGGVTNNAFSEKYKINSYVVYGFRDHRFKYSIGGGFRVNPETNTWINLSYTDDLQETGSSVFLTDKRFFQFFEPRLLNIDLFHKHITKAISLEHEISKNLLSETEFSVSNINPTYDYEYVLNNKSYREFNLSLLKFSLQWEPFNTYKLDPKSEKYISKEAFPKFTLQVTKNLKNVFKSEFSFFKVDFRTVYEISTTSLGLSKFTLSAGYAHGETPLTHLYHAYPNNINKETIMQRFSVAGINSFETMYFNEFFSDRYSTLQFRHYFKPFKISNRYRPQLVFISRFAIGDMNKAERHQNVTFGTLNKGYTESGLELNKLLFGFGLSFTYRYGAYHLPNLDDNIALKFTFNVTL